MRVAYYLKHYLAARPLFLSLIRSKEAALYDAYLPLKGPILDVGAGDGFFAKTVFKKIDVGLDVVDSRMEEARTIGVYKKLITYDGIHFPFKDNFFQAVISNCVLEHVPSLEKVVGEAYRVLKPGGTCIVTVMAKPWEKHLVGAMILGDSYKNYMRKKQVHIHLLTQKEWRTIFQTSGFHIEKEVGYLSPVACRLIDVAHYLSIPSLITYILFGRWTLFPSLARLLPISWFVEKIEKNVLPSDAGAVFFELKKRP